MKLKSGHHSTEFLDSTVWKGIEGSILQKQKTKDKFAWQTCTCINKQKRRTKQDHVGHHVVSQAITRPGSCQTFSSKQWSSPSIQEMPGPGLSCTFSDRKSSSGWTLCFPLRTHLTLLSIHPSICIVTGHSTWHTSWHGKLLLIVIHLLFNKKLVTIRWHYSNYTSNSKTIETMKKIVVHLYE